jgi:hypothetical protein
MIAGRSSIFRAVLIPNTKPIDRNRMHPEIDPSEFDHFEPGSYHRTLPGDDRYVGNLPPMPGVFPDYPAPVVRNAGAERELTMMRWEMPPPLRARGFSVNNSATPRRLTGEAG